MVFHVSAKLNAKIEAGYLDGAEFPPSDGSDSVQILMVRRIRRTCVLNGIRTRARSIHGILVCLDSHLDSLDSDVTQVTRERSSVRSLREGVWRSACKVDPLRGGNGTHLGLV